MDLSERTLNLADGSTLHGSHLVMAAGAQPNYFGVPGAAMHAFPLYSVADAERLRLHLQELLGAAIEDPESGEPGSIDVVVVGGGPTGVETTGALAELMLALHESAQVAVPSRITLVDRGDALLGQFSDKAHTYALEKLTEVGADVRLGTGVAAVYPDRVEFTDGSCHPSADRGLGRRRVRVCDRRERRALPRARWSHRRPTGPHRARLPRNLRSGRRGQHSVR